tara:strand:+ start:247 stop:786 length:540 start_codon:yes stop_codon:yes gene_type:complete
MSLGVLSPLICWYMIPDFNPIEKPLSYFGVAEITAWYWNLSLIMISLAIYLNAKKSLPIYFKKLKTLRILRILLTVSFISLFLTAIVPMNRVLLHRISATGFFLTYNFFVFFFGISRSLKYLRKGLFSIFIGSLMLLSSLLLTPFPSYGVFEIVYVLLIVFWNASLFYRRVIKEDSPVN